MLRFVAEAGKLGQLPALLVGNRAALRSCCLGVALGKRGDDEGADDAPPPLARMRQCVAHEVDATALPGSVVHLGHIGLGALMSVGEDQLDGRTAGPPGSSRCRSWRLTQLRAGLPPMRLPVISGASPANSQIGDHGKRRARDHPSCLDELLKGVYDLSVMGLPNGSVLTLEPRARPRRRSLRCCRNPMWTRSEAGQRRNRDAPTRLRSHSVTASGALWPMPGTGWSAKRVETPCVDCNDQRKWS